MYLNIYEEKSLLTGNIAKKLKLSRNQQRELHDLIHGQNWGYKEILEFAKSWFNK